MRSLADAHAGCLAANREIGVGCHRRVLEHVTRAVRTVRAVSVCHLAQFDLCRHYAVCSAHLCWRVTVLRSAIAFSTSRALKRSSAARDLNFLRLILMATGQPKSAISLLRSHRQPVIVQIPTSRQASGSGTRGSGCLGLECFVVVMFSHLAWCLNMYRPKGNATTTFKSRFQGGPTHCLQIVICGRYAAWTAFCGVGSQ